MRDFLVWPFGSAVRTPALVTARDAENAHRIYKQWAGLPLDSPTTTVSAKNVQRIKQLDNDWIVVSDSEDDPFSS